MPTDAHDEPSGMPSAHLPAGVDVHLLGPTEPGSGPALVQELLRSAPGREEALVVHACAGCGSSRHGRLVVSAPIPLWVSLSRAGSHTVVVTSDAGPVGVDVEQVDGSGADGCSGGEAGLEPLLRWCAVEAALKVTGLGLRIDPEAVRLVSGEWSGPAVVHVPGRGAFTVRPISLHGAPHLVGRVAVPFTGSGARAG